MRTLASYIVLAGWVSAFAAQIYITMRAFRHYPYLRGVLCLLVPGYVLLYATRRETQEVKALICWGAGLVAFIVGLVVA